MLAAAVLAAVAQPADYKLNVQNFCELTVVDGVNVEYHCRPDSAGWAIFTCEPEIASRIMFSNNAEKLTIQTDADESPVEGVPLVVVYSASLRRCENSGDSTLTVYLDVPVNQFKAKQIGNGNLVVHNVDAASLEAGVTAGHGSITVDGKAPKASYSNVGSGPIDASGLQAEQVKCFVFGSGNVDCVATEQLKVFGAGSGTVIYHDAPGKITNRSIGVKTSPCTPEVHNEKLLTKK